MDKIRKLVYFYVSEGRFLPLRYNADGACSCMPETSLANQITLLSQRTQYMDFTVVTQCCILPHVLCATKKLLGAMH